MYTTEYGMKVLLLWKMSPLEDYMYQVRLRLNFVTMDILVHKQVLTVLHSTVLQSSKQIFQHSALLKILILRKHHFLQPFLLFRRPTSKNGLKKGHFRPFLVLLFGRSVVSSEILVDLTNKYLRNKKAFHILLYSSNVFMNLKIKK